MGARHTTKILLIIAILFALAVVILVVIPRQEYQVLIDNTDEWKANSTEKTVHETTIYASTTMETTTTPNNNIAINFKNSTYSTTPATSLSETGFSTEYTTNDKNESTTQASLVSTSFYLEFTTSNSSTTPEAVTTDLTMTEATTTQTRKVPTESNTSNYSMTPEGLTTDLTTTESITKQTQKTEGTTITRASETVSPESKTENSSTTPEGVTTEPTTIGLEMSESITPTETRETQVTTERATIARGVQKYCHNSTCKTIASKMLRTIDHGADPCKDFFQYACGNADDINMQSSEPQLEINARLTEQLEKELEDSEAKIFYDSCTSYMSSVKGIENDEIFDGIVNVTLDFIELANLTDILVHFLKLHFSPIFEVTVEYDIDTKEFLPRLSLSAGESKLYERSDKTICLTELRTNAYGRESNLTLHEQFNSCMVSTGLNKRISNIKHITSKLAPEVGQIKHYEDLENFLQKISTNKSSIVTKKTDIANLKNYKHINLHRLLYPEGRPAYSMNETSSEEIFVKGLDSVRTVLAIIDEQWENNKENMTTFFKALWIEHVFFTVVQPSTSNNLEQFCLETMKELLPVQSAMLFLKSFPEQTVSNFEQEMKQMISVNEDVFGEASFQYWNDSLHDLESKYNVSITDNYQSNVIRLGKILRFHLYSILDKTPSYASIFQWAQLEENWLSINKQEKPVLPITALLSSLDLGSSSKLDFVSFAKIGTLLAELKIIKEPSTCHETRDTYKFEYENVSIDFIVDGQQLQDSFSHRLRSLNRTLNEYDKYRQKHGSTSDSLVWLHPTSISGRKAILILAAQAHCSDAGGNVDFSQLLRGNTLPDGVWIRKMATEESSFDKEFSCAANNNNDSAEESSEDYYYPDDYYDVDPNCHLPLEKKSRETVPNVPE